MIRRLFARLLPSASKTVEKGVKALVASVIERGVVTSIGYNHAVAGYISLLKKLPGKPD